MPELLEFLFDSGCTPESLREAVRGCALGFLGPREAAAALSLGAVELLELRRMVLREPDCVERSAAAIGLPLEVLDRAKLALMDRISGAA